MDNNETSNTSFPWSDAKLPLESNLTWVIAGSTLCKQGIPMVYLPGVFAVAFCGLH